MTEELNNEIMQLDVGKPQLQLNNEFQEVLSHIPEVVKESKDVLAIDIDDLDDKKVNELDKKLREITSFNRKIENGRKDLRSYLNNYRDSITDVFDERLSQSGYDQVPDLAAQVRQRKNDIKTHRINKRWDDLQSTFEKNIAIYPKMFDTYPDLKDFSTFKLHHDDLVSGAKTKKITEKTRAEINKEIGQWSNLLNTIEENAWGLNETNFNSLLKSFIANPTKYANDSMQLLNNAQFMKDEQNKQAAQLAELKKQQEQAKLEAAKKAQAQVQKASSKPEQNVQAKPTEQPKVNNYGPQLNQVSAQPVEKFHSEFEALNDYIASDPRFRGISGNNRIKCRLLFYYFQEAGKSTDLTKVIGQNPDEVVKSIKHILDM